jgi:hypothetical protein
VLLLPQALTLGKPKSPRFLVTTSDESTPPFSLIGTALISDYLLEALTVLKNRGYDSAGLATMTTEGGPLVRDESYSSIVLVKQISLIAR